MLSQLYIQNIAVIKEITIDFQEGLNVFTGETGAGKSVLIGAIHAILGGRVSKDFIRTGEKKAFVSALFTELSEEDREFVESQGFAMEEADELLLAREISITGKNACKINGRPAPLLVLKEIANRFVNIHGQHDNNQLLLSEYHMHFIDSYGKTGELLAEYQALYQKLAEIEKQRRSLEIDEGEKARQIDLLTYQIQEIEEAELQEGEEEGLLSQRKMIRNSEKIMDSLAAAREALDGGEDYEGAVSLLEDAAGNLAEAAKYFPDLQELSEKMQDMLYELEESANDARDFLSQMDYDPAQLEEIEDRLDEIRKLKRKYGNDYSEIQKFYELAVQKLDTISFAEERLEKLTAEQQQQRKQVREKAEALSQKRKQAGETFIREVEEELTFLNMPSVRLELAHHIHEPDMRGIDSLEFLISTNKGEPPKPMAKIASGGELSRIMLAIKNVLSDQEQVGTMIFDEVDTGVSGRAAQKIGQKLKQVSKDRQVICVTHLAQIAVYADHHLLIQKEQQEDRVFTSVYQLDESGRIDEISRIIGSETITDSTKKAAAEMLALGAALTDQ